MGGFAVGIGTIPAIAGTHRVSFGRMVRIAFGTRPIMIAARPFCQNFSAHGTKGIAARAGNRFRDHINAIAVGAMPACVTMPARSKNRVAIGTVPIFPVADAVRRMLFVAIGAIPDVGAGLPDV